MKAHLKNNSDIELNMDYLTSVGSMYTYFYVPSNAVSAELFNAVGPDSAISLISKDGDRWQVQVRSEQIEWED